MTREQIEADIRSYILEEFLPGEDAANLQRDTPLISSGVLDSLATLKLVSFLEESFRVELAAHEVGEHNLDSIARMGEFITARSG